MAEYVMVLVGQSHHGELVPGQVIVVDKSLFTDYGNGSCHFYNETGGGGGWNYGFIVHYCDTSLNNLIKAKKEMMFYVT